MYLEDDYVVSRVVQTTSTLVTDPWLRLSWHTSRWSTQYSWRGWPTFNSSRRRVSLPRIHIPSWLCSEHFQDAEASEEGYVVALDTRNQRGVREDQFSHHLGRSGLAVQPSPPHIFGKPLHEMPSPRLWRFREALMAHNLMNWYPEKQMRSFQGGLIGGTRTVSYEKQTQKIYRLVKGRNVSKYISHAYQRELKNTNLLSLQPRQRCGKIFIDLRFNYGCMTQNYWDIFLNW